MALQYTGVGTVREIPFISYNLMHIISFSCWSCKFDPPSHTQKYTLYYGGGGGMGGESIFPHHSLLLFPRNIFFFSNSELR